MPKRILDFEALWASDKLSRCSPGVRGEYGWLYGLADANGSFEVNLRAIWGRAYVPIRPDVTLAKVERIFAEFRREKLLFVWEQDGKQYGHWTGCEKRGRLPRASRRGGEYEKILAPPVPQKEYQEFLGMPIPTEEGRGPTLEASEKCQEPTLEASETDGSPTLEPSREGICPDGGPSGYPTCPDAPPSYAKAKAKAAAMAKAKGKIVGESLSKDPDSAVGKSENGWTQISQKLKARLDPRKWESWIRPIRFAGVEKGQLVLRAPTAEFKDWIKENFAGEIVAIAHELKLPYSGISWVVAAKQK